MLTSILPVGDGETTKRLRKVWVGLALIHSAGTVLAACLMGLITAWAGRALGADASGRTWVLGLALTVCLVYLPRQLGWTRMPPLIESGRQVPRRWAYDYRPKTAAFLFGLGLGSGITTRIVVPVFYLLILWTLLLGDVSAAVACWFCYGLARSVHLWLVALRSPTADCLDYADMLVRYLGLREDWMRFSNAALMLIVAGWLVSRLV